MAGWIQEGDISETRFGPVKHGQDEIIAGAIHLLRFAEQQSELLKILATLYQFIKLWCRLLDEAGSVDDP